MPVWKNWNSIEKRQRKGMTKSLQMTAFLSNWMREIFFSCSQSYAGGVLGPALVAAAPLLKVTAVIR